jgi:hypothetical protein
MILVAAPFLTGGDGANSVSSDVAAEAPHASFNITVTLVGYGNVTVSTTVWEFLETGKVHGTYQWVAVPINNQSVPLNGTTFKVVQGDPMTIIGLPNGSYVLQSFSGAFDNSTNTSVTFTPTHDGTEVVTFVNESNLVSVSGPAMLWFLYYLTLGIGTFIITLVGFVVTADFMAGTDKDKAWERMKAWLIGAILFFGGITIAPIVIGLLMKGQL